MAQTHVGIDIAKHHLDLAVWGAEDVDRLPHDQEGIEALRHRLTALAPDRIVVEATGGREVPLATALQAAGLPVAVVNPRQARAFGRASGQLAKTDRIDARLLARMAAVLQPPVRPLPDADLRALRALVVRRRQVVAMCAQEKTRLDTTAAAMQPHIQAHLDWLQTELERLNRALQDRPAEPCALVGSDRVAVQRTGCRSRRGGRTCRRTAGAGSPQPPPIGGPGRCGTPEPGQWSATRPTPDLGGPRLRAPDPLHGHHDGHLSQPSHPRLLPASLRPGQTPEGGARGRHAQTGSPSSTP